MSKTTKTDRRSSEAARKSAARGLVFAIGVAGCAGLLALALWGRKPALPQDSAADQKGKNAAADAEVARPAYGKVVGRWVRPDGGYVIEIKSVDDAGKLEAGYFNPNPIFVSRAEASAQGSMIKVFVELRDVNYPGSTYTLAYDPADDVLKGVYYQAALQQQYEVYFERLK